MKKILNVLSYIYELIVCWSYGTFLGSISALLLEQIFEHKKDINPEYKLYCIIMMIILMLRVYHKTYKWFLVKEDLK